MRMHHTNTDGCGPEYVHARRLRMRSKGETLAQQFEARIQEALTTLDRLDAADWEKTTEAERWPVGVTAHHLAGVLEPIADMIRAVAGGSHRAASRLPCSMR